MASKITIITLLMIAAALLNVASISVFKNYPLGEDYF